MMKPLSEYPRPQLVRDSYLCLNGKWEYAIRKEEDIPTSFDGEIIVPFSPETTASGINKMVTPEGYLFYRLVFKLDKSFIKDKVLLHFTAVDQIANVYINGIHLGQHIGGYLPFEFDIKPYLTEENTLIVKVKDYTDTKEYSRGKQKIKRGGIWYTPQSGIYMPVWLESVSSSYIRNIKITPDVDNSSVKITVISDDSSAIIHLLGKDYKVATNEETEIKIDNPHLWSPEDPYLYIFSIKTHGDEVTSYFALRKVSIVEHSGYKVIALNNKPYFMKGILDQGYYKDGLYTPNDYQDYISDIQLVKALGFNTIRKHIKIEAPRWYYECDRQGILVWQDFINGGGQYKFPTIAFPLITSIHHKDNNYKAFARTDEECRKQAIEEFKEIIHYLYNVPSIVLWTIFNEGWGQFDSASIYNDLKDLDNTRLFDHASGWHDQGVSDVKSLHVYFKRVKLPKDKRAIVLSEFGGFVLPVKDHMQKGKKTYRSFKDAKSWLDNYEKCIEKDVINNIPKGLTATIYTQLSDVEDELNGFITFDRQVIKIDPQLVKKINERIKF